jgi:NAD+ synthase (glutamine-hydrolysing)
MKLIHVAAGILNQTPLDWLGNKRNVLAAIARARQLKVTVLCLPELCLTGYGCEDAFHSGATHRMAWKMLMEILPSTKGMIVSVGLPVLHHNALFNCACLIVNGGIAGFVAKKFLAGDGIHYEPRWFKAWPPGLADELVVDGNHYRIGDLHFDCGGAKIGFEICEDAWVANRPGATLALQGVNLILNPSASHFAFGKLEVRKRFVLEASRAFGVSYIYSNLLGNESGRAIFDGGALIASGGKLIAGGGRFGFHDFDVTTAVIDLEANEMLQARTGSFKPDLAADQKAVTIPFVFPECAPARPALPHPDWESGSHIKEEEFARAVSLALFDYMRKSRSRGFVLSLSGGADSAAVACLIGMMVEMSVKALGLQGFAEKLRYWPELARHQTAAAITHDLLTCVYQASANSSAVTRNAAQAIAEAVGATFLEFNIETLVHSYVQMVSGALNRPLNWQQDDLALQNIQARVRSPGVWMLANIRNALLVSTSNRSEAAVGYATMDGDTSGGLSPIAGIDKAFLREWLKWMEKRGPEGLHGIPALDAINRQAPTAELRPQENKQTDEDDLMPYPLLDAIERAAIRDKQAPVDVFQLMRVQFSEYSNDQLVVWVERFFHLWCRNQWKRERYAPSFHLDDENLDPKTWCRFPILSGGFEVELTELRDYVAKLK